MRNARVVIALACAIGVAGPRSPAYAEHDHSAPAHPANRARIAASIGAIAATYRSRLYEGDYQAATLGATYTRGRFEVAIRGALYQIDRNGRTYRGLGDVMVHGAATLVERDAIVGGVHLMTMVPVGDKMDGFGMGHWMVMPAAWAAWSHPLVTVGGSLGYARAIGGHDDHHDHGTWPLVDPMTASEITYDATAMFVLAASLRAGGRVLGAIPLDGDLRAIGAARVSWRAGRIESSGEAQVGIAGDPVRIRGLLATSIAF